mgnify:CR=1 FL=1
MFAIEKFLEVIGGLTLMKIVYDVLLQWKIERNHTDIFNSSE